MLANVKACGAIYIYIYVCVWLLSADCFLMFIVSRCQSLENLKISMKHRRACQKLVACVKQVVTHREAFLHILQSLLKTLFSLCVLGVRGPNMSTSFIFIMFSWG